MDRQSTLLYHLNGTLMGEGEVIILGIPVKKNNLKEIRRRVGLVFQSPEDHSSAPRSLMMWHFALLIWDSMKKKFGVG